MLLPLVAPSWRMPLTLIAFLTDPEPITRFLAHTGEPTSPPLIHPSEGPPQIEFAMAPGGGKADEAVQESIPDDLEQTHEFDPTEPEAVPQHHYDSSWSA